MAVLFKAQELRNSTRDIHRVYRMYKHQYLIVKYAINAQSDSNIACYNGPYERHPF